MIVGRGPSVEATLAGALLDAASAPVGRLDVWLLTACEIVAATGVEAAVVSTAG
jgi:hypothetical protein